MAQVRAHHAAPRAGPEVNTGFLLWHVSLRWRRALAEALEPLELTPNEFAILGGVLWLSRERPSGPNQRQLAEQSGLDPMSASQGVRSLEKRGLLERHDDPGDTRAFQLRLTSAGEDLARRGIEVVGKLEVSFFSALGAARRKALTEGRRELLQVHRGRGPAAPP